jgi:uncharacterized membrane protein
MYKSLIMEDRKTLQRIERMVLSSWFSCIASFTIHCAFFRQKNKPQSMTKVHIREVSEEKDL